MGTLLTPPSQLVQQINSSNAGVSAAVVAVSGGSYKLLLTAGTTGAAAAFSASGTQASLAAFNTLQQGQDAKFTIGDPTGPNKIQLSRPSNQVSDLLPGVSISLGTLSATPVTVSVAQDPDAIVKSVQAVVDAYNQAAATLGGFTAYNATSKTAALTRPGAGTMQVGACVACLASHVPFHAPGAPIVLSAPLVAAPLVSVGQVQPVSLDFFSTRSSRAPPSSSVL